MNTPTTFAPPERSTAFRVSDPEREQTVEFLRENLLAGRLNLDEFETRTEEAWAARYVPGLWHAVRELPVPAAPAPVPPGRPPEAVGSLVLSMISATVLLCSFGLLFFVALPLSVAGWLMGRGVRRNPAIANGRSMARAGEIVGALTTVIICLGLSAVVGAVAIG